MNLINHPAGTRPGASQIQMSNLPLDQFQFACPTTRAPLEQLDDHSMHCPTNGNLYREVKGIWRFLRLHRAAHFAAFINAYEALRRSEGRGGAGADYYRQLPYVKVRGDNPFHSTAGWKLRARSYECLLETVVQPLARRQRSPLKIIDLGAGNGWLSNRLTQQGHHVVAVDLLVNRDDGLGAHVHYTTPFIPVQAEFEALPLAERQIDLVIFNAALHYAADYETALSEAARLLTRQGRLVIMDSPFFNDPQSGNEMIRGRAAYFAARVGHPPPKSEAEEYLTYDRLGGLALHSGLAWHLHWPVPQWRWTLRRWRARRRGEREPAQFPLVCGVPV